MKINVSDGIETGQDFSTRVKEKFDKEVVKIFDNIPSIDVSLKKQGPMILTNIVVNGVNAKAEGDGVHKSFDEAFRKLVSQLRKEKDKSVTKKKKGKK